ncbi:glycosyltransferase family 4 protein [Anaerosacchariphilus polymeriproducens]|uniref:Glycosyltransferase n=1 Tax=Anaerosacchariphilus polymeriproducens TaxID=1812858 RepID=A0A371AT43_9FIRM|nr:glycosyltransferase family 4 protein [Anaerosacchariphilus polymeriproducens]RDU22743.1 glycosyltransferase [Anaerosacchariphilus polymeriproducens]
MKILHWDEMFHPSFGYQINLLANFQAKKGHEVIIFTSDKIEKHPTFSGFGNNENIQEEDHLYEQKYGVKIVRLPIHGVISSRVIYKKGYLKKIKELNPDVLMCHTNDTLSSIRIAQKYKYLNLPIVFDNHMLEMASRNPLRKLFQIYFRQFVTPIIIKNNWTVIRTQDDEYINKCLGIPKNQTPFISFGTDTTLFHPDDEIKKKFRAEHDIPHNEFVVIYTGKLNEVKGGKLLANAFKEKFDSEKNITLIVLGNTTSDYEKEVEEIFHKSKNRILQFPTQKYFDLPKFYQASDLSIFPKQCSLSFFDAQACGLPVVSEDNNINRNRLLFDNGFNFKCGDLYDLREKILYCSKMDDLSYSKLKQNATHYIKTHWDYPLIEKQYTDILLNEVEKFEGSTKKK